MDMDLELEARDISRKWVGIIGIGYNPEVKAEYYSPPLSRAQQKEYARDMERLWRMEENNGICPYAFGLAAMASAGLIEEEI